MDVIHKLLKWVDHNQAKTAALVIVVVVMGWLTGCQPKATGLSGEKVTAAELRSEVIDARAALAIRMAGYDRQGAEIEAEVTRINEQAEAAADDIAGQVEFRQKIIKAASGFAVNLLSGGTFSATELLVTGATLLAGFGAAGAVVDGVRKDKVIVKEKAKNAGGGEAT